jgi:hypothetical protein
LHRRIQEDRSGEEVVAPTNAHGDGTAGDDCQATLKSYLETLKQKGECGGVDGGEKTEEGVSEEEALNLTFEFGGPEVPIGARLKAAEAQRRT